jgi:hypothetical protein
VVERKIITVQEVARTMLNEDKLLDKFWRDAIYTAFHILNRAQLRPNHDKTPYELWFGRSASIKHFRIFGSKCYIKNDESNLGKFYPISYERIFLGYSPNKKGLLTSSWVDPGSDLNRFPTKPSKTIGPPGKPEGNVVHRVHNAVSPEIALWVTAIPRCLQSRNEWGSGIVFFLLHALTLFLI